jgi:hypothetical protein
MGSEWAYALPCFLAAAVVSALRLRPVEPPDPSRFESESAYSLARARYFHYLVAPAVVVGLILLGVSFVVAG